MTPPPEPEDEGYRPRLIRSYTLTAGRTAAKVELALEATLRLQAGAEAPVLSPSAAQVLEVCDRRSVAEVSALTKMPIGVTRVLLGDLIEQGLVRIQATITDSTSTDERLELIERTLRGLRNY
ncbi:DUF742 domain-containing protein [Nocardioides cavernae]|jgi:hypothetical protein|uniref:DUF742 domain-containing protein n=1 Tax=Nocardioides cavernae TaxID=1921566 RepID=A0ABR8N4X9_9ACTN|nr:DUF742 domain-containing protein [Nocardioides cavernae]MBD3923223.1 DUF742 domain-containing protein [Nocardioides cavernae]MBM7511856.1 hypothetical protein [Nocardioides cavernae]